MERIWRLLVAIFLVCTAIALGMLFSLMGNEFPGILCAYGMLILAPIGIIKGFYNIFCYRPSDKEKTEEEE